MKQKVIEYRQLFLWNNSVLKNLTSVHMVSLSLPLSAPSHCHWRGLFPVKSDQMGFSNHLEPRSHRAPSRAQGHEGTTQPGSPHHASLLPSVLDFALPCNFFIQKYIYVPKKIKPLKVIGPKGLHQVAVKATHVYSLCLSLQLFTGTSGCIYSPCPATRTGTAGLATSQFDLQFHLGRLFSLVCRCGVLKMTLCWEICSGFNFLRANGWSGISLDFGVTGPELCALEFCTNIRDPQSSKVFHSLPAPYPLHKLISKHWGAPKDFRGEHLCVGSLVSSHLHLPKGPHTYTSFQAPQKTTASLSSSVGNLWCLFSVNTTNL